MGEPDPPPAGSVPRGSAASNHLARAGCFSSRGRSAGTRESARRGHGGSRWLRITRPAPVRLFRTWPGCSWTSRHGVAAPAGDLPARGSGRRPRQGRTSAGRRAGLAAPLSAGRFATPGRVEGLCARRTAAGARISRQRIGRSANSSFDSLRDLDEQRPGFRSYVAGSWTRCPE